MTMQRTRQLALNVPTSMIQLEYNVVFWQCVSSTLTFIHIIDMCMLRN